MLPERYTTNKHQQPSLLLQLIYRNILDLGADVPNSDRQYVIDPAQFTCTDNCEEFEVVLLRVRLADPYVDETTQRQ